MSLIVVQLNNCDCVKGSEQVGRLHAIIMRHRFNHTIKGVVFA